MRTTLKGAKLNKEENVPLKSECMELTKSRRKSKFNLNGKRKERRAYIAWEDIDNASTLSDSDNN